MFCTRCGQTLQQSMEWCGRCGKLTRPRPSAPPQMPRMAIHAAAVPSCTSLRLSAGLLAIFLGYFGVHKFALGMTGAGLTMLLITLLSCFWLSPVMALIGLIEGVIYLSQTEANFHRKYIIRKQAWF